MNLLRGPLAALRGARSLAYPSEMSRSLRAARLATDPLATISSHILS
ncbi:hypothetical protein IAI53_13955 [Thauera sp. CAU 1555]|uniref:Uncharacterized protein n=1 Tax=Thauera sedimentorum TaxID=2767595 RepID=A0ABR9BCC4_9RHOO|nr:hypothetical protein [Thauera sedimentorum]MBC9073076.1 hypothetical protein [Thauera sedimentorum]MBD8503995.1 hypothetical protein [Thauera sedimentorum]